MKRFLSLFILLLSITMARAQVNGCTDGVACNYDQAATSDDGSCVYPSMSYYPDFDGDGFGTNDMDNGPTAFCSDPGYGWSLNNFDCNDSDASVNTTGFEVCNDIDDNCDGQIDEGLQNTYYTDMDGDGYGSMNFWSIQACTAPMGFASSSNDCADENPAINP